MRYSCIVSVGIFCVLLSSVIGSYEAGYGTPHDLDEFYEPSYPAPPTVHPHHGHSAGSYYHYHVPLVGQQQHYQPHYQHHDHSHYLWPLLLLLALPLLFLPLLPLLLLPLGISLLALLAPGGMMMMMMMMMMMGGGMMMRTDTISGRAFNEMRTFGEILFSDMTSLLAKYARSLDLDECPQRMACEMGAIFFPENNSTSSSTAKAFSSFIMEQYIPKGKVRKTIKQFEKAFWSGSTSLNSCNAFHCQPTFRVYKNNALDPDKASAMENGSPLSLSTPPVQFNESRQETSTDKNYYLNKSKKVNFVYPASSKANANDIDHNTLGEEWKSLPSNDSPSKIKRKRSHHIHTHQHLYGSVSKLKKDANQILSQNSQTSYFNMFGTPTVQS